MKGLVSTREPSLPVSSQATNPAGKFDLADFHTDSRTTIAASLSSREVWLTPLEIAWHTTLVMIPTILMIYVIHLCSATRVTMYYALFAGRIVWGMVFGLTLWPLTDAPQDVTRKRISWYLISYPLMQGLLASALVYSFTKYDEHWYFINHQMVLHMVWYLVGVGLAYVPLDQWANPKNFRNDPVTGQPPSCRQTLIKVIQISTSYCIGNIGFPAILLVASVVRYHLLHELHSNVLMRCFIVGCGQLAQIVLSKGMPLVMVAMMPKPADDETPLRLARTQEVIGYYCAYYSLFATKLLVTALQGPVEAWCCSFLSAILEVADTLYGFWSDTRKLNALRAELPSKVLTAAEASEYEDKKAADIIALRRSAVLRAMRYLSIMMLEYVATATAVCAAVVFEKNRLITGLSAGYWDVRTGLSFLLAQFVPEFISDVLGLAILVMFGLSFRELFVAVHCSVACLAFKAVTGPFILPLVVLCALERKWG